MADKLSDELLKRIATGSGRCYGYEGRAMAAELLERREAEKKAAQQAQGWGLAGQVLGGTP